MLTPLSRQHQSRKSTVKVCVLQGRADDKDLNNLNNIGSISLHLLICVIYLSIYLFIIQKKTLFHMNRTDTMLSLFLCGIILQILDFIA